jgi:polysaccharide export outer membrane protein
VADSPRPDVERTPLPVADEGRGEASSYSFRRLVDLIRRRRKFLLGTVGGLLLLCLLYCLIAPNQYEAASKIGLRLQPASSLTVDAAETMAPASILSTPLQLETLVNVLRSERLAWRVIVGLRLYESAAFSRTFASRFPGFDPQKPAPEAEGYLLETFAKRLRVRTLPRTLLIEVGFRSRDPAQAAQVANAVVEGYMAQEGEGRVQATGAASGWLQGQLNTLTARVELKEKQLANFERDHGFMTTQQTMPGGQPVETLHDSTVQAADEAARMLETASGDRILREALYGQAKEGNPEQVLAANPELQAEMGPGGTPLTQKLRAQSSEVEVELAQLKTEHGPKFPRVVELDRAGQEIAQQIQAEDANLLAAFERAWKAASEREAMLQKQLDARTSEALRQNDFTIEYTVLHDEVISERELCTRLNNRIQDAGLAAGVRGSSITVVDPARIPFKPSAPDAPLYLVITFFSSLWVALGGALALDAIGPPMRLARRSGLKNLAVTLLLILAGSGAVGQAPTPNTQGLPSGVVKLPSDAPTGIQPNAKEAPPVWNSAAPPSNAQALPEQSARAIGVPMALPIAAGDFLEVNEFHTPEFRSAVRVAADGTVLLSLVGQVKLLGMTEQEASQAIEKAFLDGGMLLHPQVSVLVTAAIGQDVSVLGEVARPGVYPYTVHHRLLDLISAASGLSPNAGRLVSVFHRDDPRTPHPVVLDPTGTASAGAALAGTGSTGTRASEPESKVERNPELAPGDTVLVSRAGLVYVIGDVVRPGGFAVDPIQGLTVVQALSLAWGATPNASAAKAILIRDQTGGRTLTTLNLRRMIRGQDPDLPIHDRDILFIPDSAAKNLLNKTLESAIQSAVGVSIYAGLVYSQRF